MKSDNTVYCWGNNDYGKLGVEPNEVYIDHTLTVLPELLPVQAEDDSNTDPVVFLQDVDQVFTSTTKTCVLLLDDTVKCRGRDFKGQLGIGLSQGDKKESFVFVKTDRNTDLTGVQQMSSRSSYSIVILDDGSVYGWGRNDNDQLSNIVYEDAYKSTSKARDLGLPTSGGGGGDSDAADAGDGGGWTCAPKYHYRFKTIILIPHTIGLYKSSLPISKRSWFAKGLIHLKARRAIQTGRGSRIGLIHPGGQPI